MVYGLTYRTPYKIQIGTRIIDKERPTTFAVQFSDPNEVPKYVMVGVERMTRGFKVDPALVPGAVRWESKNKAPTDLIIAEGVPIVSSRMKDLIDGAEHGVHQFIPVDLFRPKAPEPFEKYYWLVVAQRIDSADPLKTTHLRSETRMWLPNGTGKFVFNRHQIGNAKLWRDPDINEGIFCSNDLTEIFLKTGITGLSLYEHPDT